MFNLRAKKTYQVPHVTVADVDLEGLICNSVRFNVQVNSLENMNNPTDPTKGVGDAEGEVFYFES